MSPDDIIEEALEIFEMMGEEVFSHLSKDQLLLLADSASKELNKRRRNATIPVNLRHNRQQLLQLEHIKDATFHNLDGSSVVEDLINHKNLWRAAMIGRSCNGNEFPTTSSAPLLPLRDLERNILNVDTLHILPTTGKEQELESLAQTWGPDELDWIPPENAARLMGGMPFPAVAGILRCWWD